VGSDLTPSDQILADPVHRVQRAIHSLMDSVIFRFLFGGDHPNQTGTSQD
jgi:hypothetical protein